MEFHQYTFEHFYFKNGQLFTKDQRVIYLAPKECAVLLFMLENANAIITKDAIIDHVWKGGLVSDESLTRCIYVLRRALGHTSKKRFIDNVYGKGYRFVPSVALQAVPAEPRVMPTPSVRISDIALPKESSAENACSIALLLFDMRQRYQAASLHDQLVDWLHCQKLPINVVSSFFTRSAQDQSSYLLAIEKSRADYYISGVEIAQGDKSIIRIELTRAQDHTVLHREGVQFTTDYHLNYRLLCRAILTLLSAIKPGLGIESGLADAGRALNQPIVPHDALQFSIPALKKYMPKAVNVRGYRDNCVNELCRVAGSYYAIANLGLMDYESVRSEMMIIVAKILASEPNNVIALSLQGLLLCAENNKEAASKFHLAMLLSPSVAEVYYYYACHLVRQGDFNKALQMNNMCMELNENYYSPKILRVIIYYSLGDIQEAIKYGEAVLATESPGNTIMSGLLALIYARRGEIHKAKALARNIEKYKLSCEFVWYCYNEVAGAGQSLSDPCGSGPCANRERDANAAPKMMLNRPQGANSFFLASWLI